MCYRTGLERELVFILLLNWLMVTGKSGLFMDSVQFNFGHTTMPKCLLKAQFISFFNQKAHCLNLCFSVLTALCCTLKVEF